MGARSFYCRSSAKYSQQGQSGKRCAEPCRGQIKSPFKLAPTINIGGPRATHLANASQNFLDSNVHLPNELRKSLVLGPESKPLPEEQLATEIKAIYSGLVMIESKCIAVVNAENDRLSKPGQSQEIPPADHWSALISLHRALLQEHHDFFLASPHPAASPQLKNLAIKYSIPARMWKHGIHSFLELLRHSLPHSMEFTLAFIILAYQMIALLYETVDSFKDTWIECLGDLARYRMAIEDKDPHDRDVWTTVSRTWYHMASRRNVNLGRLFHHQAILARMQPLRQLSLYRPALGAVHPFTSARESIMTLIEPVLARIKQPGASTKLLDSQMLRLVAMLYTKHYLNDYYLVGRLYHYQSIPASKTSLELLSMFQRPLRAHQHSNITRDLIAALSGPALSWIQNNVLPIDDAFPYEEVGSLLNDLLLDTELVDVKSEAIEKIVLRGDQSVHEQVWAQTPFPPNNFADPDKEDDYRELLLTTRTRDDCIISLGYGIAANGGSEQPTAVMLQALYKILAKKNSFMKQLSSFVVLVFTLCFFMQPVAAMPSDASELSFIVRNGPALESIAFSINTALTIVYSAFENDKTVGPILSRLTLLICAICAVAATWLHARIYCGSTFQKKLFVILTSLFTMPVFVVVTKFLQSAQGAAGIYLVPAFGLTSCLLSFFIPWHRPPVLQNAPQDTQPEEEQEV